MSCVLWMSIDYELWTFNKALLKFDILHFAKCVRDLCAFYVYWLWVVSKILLNCILYFDKWLYPFVVCFNVYRYWIVNKTLYDCVCELWAFNVSLLRVANRIPIRKGIFQVWPKHVNFHPPLCIIRYGIRFVYYEKKI